MKKLNWGCGSIQPKDWDNVDKDYRFAPPTDPGNFYTSLEGYQANSFDIIVAHCSLQMNDFNQIVDVLKELYRVLKPGGVLRISLPDIERGFQEYARGNINWFPNSELDLGIRFSAWLTWYSTTKTLLTRGALVIKLHEAGFETIMQARFMATILAPSHDIVELDTREHECYFMEAQK